MCATLTISIDSKPGTVGSNAGMFAVADVLPLAAPRPNFKIRPIMGVVVSVGNVPAPTTVEVPPGEWLVRAKMPSGEVISQSVTVSTDHPATATLQGQVAPADDLQFEFAAGAVPSARTYAKQLSRNVILSAPLQEIVAFNPSASQKGRSFSEKRRSPTAAGSLSPVSRSSQDDLFIREQPRAAVGIFERELLRHSEVKKSGLSFRTILSAIDTRATQAALSGDDSILQLAARLFGEMKEARDSKLDGATLLKSASVNLPTSLFEAGNTWSGGEKPVRAFGWLRAASGDKAVIACIPHSWRVARTGAPASVRAVLSGDPGDSSRLGLCVVVDDPGVTSILGFLQTGDLDSAERLTRQSLQFLNEKEMNPYAAAAAAYALVHSPGAADVSEPWPQWIRNLTNWFPDIPDGPVLLATLLLQRGAGELAVGRPGSSQAHDRQGFHECRKLLLRAVCGGPPIFRLGLRLLAENIDIVRNLERELESPTKELDRAASLVRWMSLRVDTSQPFTVLRV